MRYRGYYYDRESGLYYLQSRYYDPNIGRFINADNQLSTGELTGFNMFAYCGNNPVNRIDPTGHDWWHWVAAAAIVVVAAAAVVVTAGGAAAAVAAVASVASGVAAATTASTVAAGVFIGTSTALAVSAYSAAANSNSAEEFADYGASALTSTVTGGSFGGAYGYSLSQSQNYSNSSSVPSEGICFVAGTMVKMQDGHIPIEEIVVGDYVWAWSEDTNEVDLKPVVETYVNETRELIHVFVNGEEIITTPSHPFYSPLKGWTSAVKLRAGDILVLVNGEYVVVEKIQHEILETPVVVYNFQVAEYHTYFVAQSCVLVHNSCQAGRSLPKNGTTMNTTDALDLAIDYLGPGYTEASPGRFVSADNAAQVRIGTGELLGLHAGGPHINFDQLLPKYKTSHIFFFD